MSNSTNISVPYSYYNDPAYNGYYYSKPVAVYSIIFGASSALGNLYLIFLFSRFSKLRTIQCNWLIIFLCIADVMIGWGTVMKPIVNIVTMDNVIMELNFYLCTSMIAPWALGYRTGQTIALLMAFDRLVAIWKPTFYAQRQGNNKNMVVVSAIIILLVFGFLFFCLVYGANSSIPMTLGTCQGIWGIYYFKFNPTYSAIVSVSFFVIYSLSLIMFAKQVRETKKKQTHAYNQISKVQRKISTTVSIALLLYSLFYVIPTLMQMSYEYCGLPIELFNYGGLIIVYGAQLNGTLNAVIYLVKHQEFKECHKRFIYGIRGKSLHSEHKTTKVFAVVKDTLATSNIVPSPRSQL